MKRLLLSLVLVLVVSSLFIGTADARRGNPQVVGTPSTVYVIVDSDDNHALTPTYNFTDTLYDYVEWVRVSGFANTNDASVAVDATPAWSYRVAPVLYSMFKGSISTNGVIVLKNPDEGTTQHSSPNNVMLPSANPADSFALFAPLWADWELRTSGDSSKIFYRVVQDTTYVSFYNMGLRGTNGQVRATFQAVFTKDTAVTYHYRSFSGSWAGLTAAQLIQRVSTIGMQNETRTTGSVYLHKGQYFAHSSGSQLYAKDLHDGLAVRFRTVPGNLTRMQSLSAPSADRVELTQALFTPSGRAANLVDDEVMIYIKTQVVNLATGVTVINNEDSVLVFNRQQGSLTEKTFQGLPCGPYRVTMTSRIPEYGADPWLEDNTLGRTFFLLSTQSVPFYEEFNSTYQYCAWANLGGEVRPGAEVMYDPVSPRLGHSGAMVLDRRDGRGFLYANPEGGDTLVSAPFNLTGKSNLWLEFAYQRGLKSDNHEASVQRNTKSGPDRTIRNDQGIVEPGDSLIIEGLNPAGARWNPTPSSWRVLGVIEGGLDTRTQKFRLQLPTNIYSDHFRFRFRLKARGTTDWLTLPHDDNDSYVIDAIKLIAPANGQTEFEVMHVDLGNREFTHVPRDIQLLTPKMTIANNGRSAGLGSFIARMIIRDQLNREVYHRTTAFAMTSSFADTVIGFPQWDIKGSQGGVFSVRTTIEQNFSEFYRNNDTNTFTRTMFIDDAYALDDNAPDTANGVFNAMTEWYYDFIPLSADSLRGLALYFHGASGTSSFSLEARHEGTLLGTRNLSFTPDQAGFTRVMFAPIRMIGNDTVRLHIKRTSGSGTLAGDASKGGFWLTRSSSESTYIPQYPDVLNNIYLAGPASWTLNSDTTGLLIPMFRLIYSGSSTYLPLELLKFAGRRTSDGRVELEWKTAKEENVGHFVIEREEANSWSEIARVNSKGGHTVAAYAVSDPTATADRQTYRLIENDLDGTTQILGHVTIGAMGTTAGFAFYPNPARDQVHLEFTGGNPEELRVIDALGRVVVTMPVNSSTSTMTVDVTQLSSGLYFIESVNSGVVTRQPMNITK